MKILGKNIRMLLIMGLLSYAVTVNASVAPDSTASPAPKSLQKTEKRDWHAPMLYRPSLIFTRNLMGEETGVYTSTNGFPGNAGVLMLRGLTTVNLNSSPYVIVDGLPVRYARNASPFVSGLFPSNLEFINPLDITHIKIVSNGYDASFYGGRAGNGIIELDLDKGTLGSATIDVIARVGFSQADYSLDVMDPTEFRAYLYDMMVNAGISVPELQNNILFDPSHPKYSHHTSWMDEFKQNGMFKDFQLKMKGGDGDTRYMFSLGYSGENETLKESNDQRFNLRFNLDYKITPKIRVANYFSYNYGTSRYWGEGTDWAVNPVYLSATKAPFMSRYQYSDDGVFIDRFADADVLGKSNPAFFKDNLENKGNSSRIDAVIKGIWDINTKTSVNTDIMVTYNSATDKMHRAAQGIVPDRYIDRQNSKRSYSDYLLKWNFWMGRKGNITEALSFDSKLGFSMENYQEKVIYVRKVNAATDEMESIETGKLTDSLSNTKYDHNLLNFYLNGAFHWKNRIHLAANVQIERSSNFGPNGSWNLYAGADLGINLLQTENHLVDLYAQWGRTGNNDLRGSYYCRMYRPNHYYGYGGIYLGTVRNDNLKPEYTDNYDFGIKTRLFNDRLNIQAGYYIRKTKDLLTRKDLAIEVGLDPQFENNGNVTNQGIEASVDIRLVQSAKVNWNFFANISTLKNEVKHLNNGEIVRTLDKYTGVAREGEALGSFYGYKVLGVYKASADVKLKRADGTLYQAGDYQMEDIHKDGIINTDDRQVIGSPLPKFFGGFGTHFSYKGLSLSALFTYSYGNDVYNLFNQKLHSMTDYSNQSKEVINRWFSEANPGDGTLPRAAYGDPSNNFATSDRWVEDGSYLKLKNVSVSYQIPFRNTSGFIKGINVFANCSNLFTVTGYSGFDPEVFSAIDPLLRGVDTGASPNPRSYIFGIKLSL